MRKIFIVILSLLSMLLLSAPLFAQAATVIYGEGYGFTMLRDSEELYYDVLYDDVVGLGLKVGDYVSTDEGTFLEIQLNNSANVLKISENTSFQIAAVSGTGGGQFSLTYGRVRAKVSKLISNDQFHIQGPSAVAGVRGTDFGFDIIADIGAETQQVESVAQVYCFEGKVEVAKIKKAEAGDKDPAVATDLIIPEEAKVVETVTIEANQMVMLAAEPEAEPLKEEFKPRQIEEEINVFWSQNDFTGELIDYPEPVSDEPAAEEKAEEKKPEPLVEKEPAEEIEFQLQEEERKETARKNFFAAGTAVVGVGVLIEVTGILLNFFGAEWFGGDASLYQDVGTALMIAGGGVTAGGLITYLGILVNR